MRFEPPLASRRASVLALTWPVPLITFDTVIMETPARSATVRIVTAELLRRLRLVDLTITNASSLGFSTQEP